MWQPIETAPKDGIPIIIYSLDEDHRHAGSWVEEGHGMRGGFYWFMQVEDLYYPGITIEKLRADQGPLVGDLLWAPIPSPPLSAPKHLWDRRIDYLEISIRAASALTMNGVTTVGKACNLGEVELLRLPNFGRKSLAELKAALLTLNVDIPIQRDTIKPLTDKQRGARDRCEAVVYLRDRYGHTFHEIGQMHEISASRAREIYQKGIRLAKSLTLIAPHRAH